MSVLQYQQGLTPTDIQIWNNAAFDHGSSEEPRRFRAQMKPLLVKKVADSFESVSTKENRSPLFKNSLLAKSPTPAVKPLHPNRVLENPKFGYGAGNLKPGSIGKDEEEIRDEKKIDKEIEEIEKQIILLSSRLEALKMEKAEKSVKNVEKRGRTVTAKFLEPKQSLKNADGIKKIEERFSLSEKARVQRRGLSLGPSEILSAVKSPLFGKITPIQPINNRRKSCFWKLQDIDEENQRKTTMAKPFPSRQAVTTLPSNKTVKKDEVFLSSVQPKKLFDKSTPANSKKSQRAGRIIPSRYNQNMAVSSALRKRSLPLENDKDDDKRCDKKLSLWGTEIRVKKRWEIPEEIVLHQGSDSEKSPESPPVVPHMLLLPRIKTGRCVKESPRDSGPAKRVAELVGKKSFFCNDDDDDDDEERVICQALSFEEEDDS
ncbi:unnamed protein product [Cuscuta epithymum]|uniref:Uncharacterized protein n=1 Tax=Cuscuta epithymum TaxID=186058 RepID=A0AAV0DSF9_9ASTE|nr:unnamed protein product [Cuscuta epithymum]